MTLTDTRAALRREIGPPTDRDHKWQPMIAASEVRALLDALDAVEALADHWDAIAHEADAMWTEHIATPDAATALRAALGVTR